MDFEVLKSYLVSLGFAVDQPTFRQFDTSLKQAAHVVETHTSGIAKQLLGWQATITGAFVSISGAVLGMADHVAMADQEYRLFALRMFMTQDTAKRLKIGLDALGASLEEVAWDPELHARFLQLQDDQTKLQASLGSGFEGQMRSIRDLRFEFTRLRVELQYLGMQFVSSLFSKFGLTIDDVQKKLEAFNAWVQQHLPEIGDSLATDVLPILKQTWLMIKSLGQVIAEAATVFTNFIGLLSGDESIEGTEFSFHKLAGAIEHVVSWMAQLVQWMSVAEKLLVHVIDALALALSGHFSAALDELKAGLGDLTKQTGALFGAVPGVVAGGVIGGTAGTMGGAALGAAIGTAIAPGLGTAVGTVVGAIGGTIGTMVGAGAGGAVGGAAGYGIGSLREGLAPGLTNERDIRPAIESGQIRPGSQTPTDTASQAYTLAMKAGAQTGIDPRLIFEQWAHETGNFTNRGARDLNNLGGVRIPGTTTYQKFASLDEYEKYFVGLLQSRRYSSQNIQGAKNEEEYAGALKRGGYYEDAYSNYVRGMKNFGNEYAQMAQRDGSQPPAQTVTVDVGGINVMQPNASPEQIQTAVTDGVRKALRQQTELQLAQLSPGY
ncbi:MAG TPA: glucosaminidase domain-containing protein [Candidatus Binataceae bacterium]|nr:glucosaminidase domain-containing protein [Candidatus Binataceae bacterium]